MIKATAEPLEYRLIKYVVPIPCYICGANNTYDSEFCHLCLAPMSLAHQANAQDVKPEMIGVIGPSGVGKTVFLGMLMDMLSQPTSRIQALARGAFSITMQQNTISALAHCAFPHKTPTEPDRWNWVHCQVRRPGQRHDMEMLMPDMAGEAILDEVEHPNSYRIIAQFLKKSAGAMVLIDASQLQEGGREQDFFSMKLLTYLNELDAEAKQGWCKRPLAVILTKADCCDECRDDPADFARTHAAGLWQLCRQRFERYRFFAASVSGACLSCNTLTEGRLYFPLRIEPHGIVEPFEWLVEQLETK